MEVGLNIYPAPTDQLIIQEEFISPSSTSCCRVSFAADVIDKQRRGREEKLREIALGGKGKTQPTSHCRFAKSPPRKAALRSRELELELFDGREIENWSFVPESFH